MVVVRANGSAALASPGAHPSRWWVVTDLAIETAIASPGLGDFASGPRPTLWRMHRIFATAVSDVYPHYVTKVEKKGRTKGELDEVIRWLTGFDQSTLEKHLADKTTFTDFFEAATLNPHSDLITGSVCGVKVQEVEDPLMRRIRYLDKLVDELARGKAMDKVLRG